MSQNVKFEQVVKIVNEFSTLAEKKGLAKLYTEDENLSGRLITLNGKTYINFGSCSYLGLEIDPRLKEAAIDAIKKYGTYFSTSRIYVSCGNYHELEDLLTKVFDTNIILTTNTTLGHHTVMPIIIGANEMVIFDQQAHISMQELSYKLSHYGTGITVLRHNRLDELEQKYEQFKSKYDKIWYVVDGVYSMFGDLAPIKDIIALLDKHKKLHLYVDDAHGMSWAGLNGRGYTLSQTPIHPKMILGTSMAKGFGSCGGIFLFPNKDMWNKVKGWGGPLAYSGPQEPATIGACIASAKIHLSNEIYELQDSLQKKIQYCNQLMRQYKVPLVSESSAGIFFVACGLPRVGFNLVLRLMEEGFYTNLGIFPAVPETCTGVRFTMNNHLTYEDIDNLVKAFVSQHPKALKEEGRDISDIYKAFRKFTDFEKRLGTMDDYVPKAQPDLTNEQLQIQSLNSIQGIDKELWNSLLGDNGLYDYDNLLLLEKIFSNNDEPENNWKFFYYLVHHKGNPILATFFTSALAKDDMAAQSRISEEIEKIRKTDPYYLTSKYMMMGSLLTNGSHLYLDRENETWKQAMDMLLGAVNRDYEKEESNALLIRDFDEDDNELRLFFIDNGFFKIEAPSNNVISGLHKFNLENYFSSGLNKKQRYQLKTETLQDIEHFTIKINNVDSSTLKQLYELYQDVKGTNFELNTFALSFKFFEMATASHCWEVVQMIDTRNDKMIGMGLCALTENSYCPLVFGTDRSISIETAVYKKMLYFTVRRALELGKDNVYLGSTAEKTKQKFGAQQIKQVAYIQVKDKYNQDLIDSMAFDNSRI